MDAIRALAKFVRPYWLIALLGPILMIIEVAMDLLQPLLMKQIIDVGIANHDYDYVIIMGIWMIVTTVIGLIGGLGCVYFSTKTAVYFAADVRQALFAKIVRFSEQNRDKFGVGKLITLMTNDISTLQTALSMVLRVLVRGPLLFIGSLLIVFVSANELSPVLYVVIPVLLLIVFVIGSRSGKLFQRVQEAIDRVNTKLQENLAGMRVVQAYVQQKREIDQFQHVNDHLTKANRSAMQVGAMMMPLIMFVVNGGIVGTLWLGSYHVANHSLEIGEVLAFINYLMVLLMALMSISMVSMFMIRAIPSAGRIQEVMATPNEIVSIKDAYKPEKISGKVEFRHVSFRYSKHAEQVLSDISFSVQPGETIGIIGATGSGKSTLVKLLARLYDVDTGEILLDDVPIDRYDLQTLREAIGFVPQKATLFAESIGDNIRYGWEDAEQVAVEQAATHAAATEFIERLDQRYDYMLMQGATNLSGGQKQRLALARALLRPAPILILDDVTSAVDANSEAFIQEKLQARQQTIFLIASKISSIIEADRILVLDDGKLVGQGTHQQLVEHCNIYQEIYSSQVGELPSAVGREG